MSYLDPQRWGDVNAAGDALDWTNRKGKLLYPGYEMLRKAIVERCLVAGIGLPPDYPPIALRIPRAPGEIYVPFGFGSANFLPAFQQTITDLIPQFTNHTDHNGKWNGIDRATETFAQVWTEATILEAIGDDERLVAGGNGSGNIFLAEWAVQQYKILNMLRWRHTGITSISTFDGQEKKGAAGTWNPTVAAYIADPWSSIGTIFNLASSVKRQFDDDRMERERCKVRIDWEIPMNVVVDWYAEVSFIGANFDNEGLPFSDFSYWLYAEGLEYIKGEKPSGPYPTDREDPYVEPPDTPPSPSVRSWDVDARKPVVKFDVPGGFKFMDK